MKNKKGLIQKAEKLGFKYEKEYRGCAQCTIFAVLTTLGIDNPYIFKAASGLASGGGKMCDGICGGYAGGIMIMSLVFGRSLEKIQDDNKNKNTSFLMATQLREEFINNYGTVICEDVHQKIFGHKFNMYDEIEKQQFDNEGAHVDKCTSVVAFASREVMKLILNEAERREMTLDDIIDIASIKPFQTH